MYFKESDIKVTQGRGRFNSIKTCSCKLFSTLVSCG